MTAHLGDLVAPLVDGQLDHDTRDRALVHVTHCPACQREVVAHRALKARLSSLDTPDLPSPLVNRIVGLGASAFASAEGFAPAAPFGPAEPFARAESFGPTEPLAPPTRFAFPLALPGVGAAFGLARHRSAGPALPAPALPAPANPAPVPPVAAPPADPYVAFPVARRAAGRLAADRRRAARRTVLGSAAAVVLTVGGGATLVGTGSGASGASIPAVPATPAAVVSERGAGGRVASIPRPLPDASVFDMMSISFYR